MINFRQLKTYKSKYWAKDQLVYWFKSSKFHLRIYPIIYWSEFINCERESYSGTLKVFLSSKETIIIDLPLLKTPKGIFNRAKKMLQLLAAYKE